MSNSFKTILGYSPKNILDEGVFFTKIVHHAAVTSSNEGIRISSILRRLDEIFNQESTGSTSNMDARLFSELTDSIPPPFNGGIGTPPKTPFFNEGSIGNPEIGDDGTARWTIPLTVTLGVGQVPKISNNKPNTETPKIVNTDLTTALQALEDTKNRVYYSKVQDDNDIESYYPDLAGLNPTQLFETLSDLLTNTHTTSLSYKNARLNHLYPWIDRRDGTNRQLRGIYSNKVFDALEMIKQEAEMEMQREQITRERFMESFQTVDESFLEELEAAFPFNCEHVVPQSWFNKEKQPKTDLHHLFTCEWGCNSFRSNHTYFEFGLEAFRDNCGENSKGKFEPKNGKGAVARATLYFLLRYPKKVANSNKEMPVERIQTIIDWAKNDKIDRWERHRNAEIFKVQGNRNPFIDFPDLVDKIEFSLVFA